MMDVVIAWLLAHPLQSVCGLSVVSVLVALVLVPHLHEYADHAPARWHDRQHR